MAVGALPPLLELVKRRRSLRKDYIEALDEMGTCLQAQKQYDKAERYYLRALAVAKKELKQERSSSLSSSLLNNYAELLRKTERSVAALPFYKQAIALDRARSDINSQLLTEHNLALALDDVGRTNEAAQLFRSIQKVSRKKKLWEHYVRAWLALADSAWIHGERNTALRRYRKVRSLCAQYRLSELFLHVALNEAQLLQQMDRNESALALLNPLRNQFLLSKHCLALFLTLGR
ncbi:MAG: tetratricopeptide repeat protein, partial [Candidatus Binatia bacterium]